MDRKLKIKLLYYVEYERTIFFYINIILNLVLNLVYNHKSHEIPYVENSQTKGNFD